MDPTENPNKDDGSAEIGSKDSTKNDKSLTPSTQCKTCKKNFKQSTILKHITFKASCRINYTDEEIQLYHQWSKERHNKKRLTKLKKSYNPAKRRERHLQEQKKKDQLKAKSNKSPFVSVSTRCKSCKIVFPKSSIFRHISHNKKCLSFYSDDEIQSFSDWRGERRNESQRKSYDCTRRQQKGQRYLDNKADITKRYHENIGKYIEKPSDRKTIKGQSFAKIFDKAFDDAVNEFFADLCLKIEGIVTKNDIDNDDKTLDHEKLEEKIVQQTKAMASKLWWHPFPRFQNIYKEKDKLYKDAFAIFYHGTPFLEAYNKTYDSCLDEVMNSHHTCCTELTSVDVALCGSVEKHCEGIFERSFFMAIMEASEEYVIKYMIEFLVEEFEKKFPLTPQHQDRIKNWLKREK